MSTYADKIDIIQWIAGLDDKSTLKQLKKIKELSTAKKQDWWDTITQQERQSIERGLEDSKKGRVTQHSEVRKKYEKWL